MPKVKALGEKELSELALWRLKEAKKDREVLEPQWDENLQVVNNPMSENMGQINLTFDHVIEMEAGEVDSGDADIGINYVFKYSRFLHSQLSANPPSATVSPATTDPEDLRKADSADRILRHGYRDKNMQEIFDRLSLNTIDYGIGILKQVWDQDLGDVHDFDQATMMITMKGDIKLSVPSVKDVWADTTARCQDDIKWVVERHKIPFDEAVFKFPDYEEDLQEAVSIRDEKIGGFFDSVGPSAGTPPDQLEVEIYEYTEKGLPINGMAGRHFWFLEKSGKILGIPGKNPHYHQRLPYHFFTYIDVPDAVYGKSVIEYASRIQDMLNRFDSSVLDNLQAHNAIHLLVHEEDQSEAEADTNSGWDVRKWGGTIPPQYMSAPSLMQDGWRFREQLVLGIQELFGINDSMLGIQRREQSALSQQTAIEAGTMIHRRLFKKYAMVVESVYKDYLGLVKENWVEPRIVEVLGKEKALNSTAFKGADIAGGYDVFVEYGTSLPIDPNLRREAILLMKDLLVEAGTSPKQILQHLKLNDLQGLQDRTDLSRDRQQEIFQEMLAKLDEGHPEPYVAPRQKENHSGRLEYAYDYLESSEFKYLSDEAKELIERHVEEREQLATEAASGAAPAPGGAPAPVPGMPGVSGAITPDIGGAPPGPEAGPPVAPSPTAL